LPVTYAINDNMGLLMQKNRTIVLVTDRPEQLKGFFENLLQESALHVQVVESAQAAVEAVGYSAPLLVVVDHQVGTVSGLEIVRHLLSVDAFVHTAVLSDLDDTAFHEQSEGLGILCKLPILPGRQETRDLIERFRQMLPDQAY
jgi:CheY-like chemotaxis protein